ncbi:protein 4.1-like isoform X4 [Oncorhynchus nerka]|uniref:protein 4.1-like isoform X4 n=1 Tax=Oncorhynchus nerka TaxID=8023 RepID=UPI0031B88761
MKYIEKAVAMTTDEATERQQQKKPSQQEAEQHQATPPDHGPSESQASSTPVTSPLSPGPPSSPQEEVQLRPRQRTSADRGLSRLFSSFLKRRSQCEGDGGEKGEKGGDGGEAKAPIADCEPELRIEGDQNLDLHSLSSNEAQPVQVDQKEGPEKDSEDEGGEKDKEKREEDSAQEKEKKEEDPEGEGEGREGEEGEGEKELKEKIAEEDAQTPKPPRRPRIMQIKVTLLDDTLYECELDKHAKGVELFTKVCDHLNLLERDYYGLAIWESPSMKTWMDFTKEIRRQVQGINYDFTFNVKFYPPDPAQLSEDITRYYLCLQLRKDILGGRLPCSFVTLALLGSYALQSELGEYDPETHAPDYAKDLRLAPGQTKGLEEKVMELHKTYRSMSPAQADMAFLENAKKLAMYGVDLHQAKDLDGVDIMLGVCSGGLMVYKDKLRINRFPWPKVLKVSYKRSSFFIKIRPSEQLEHYESAIGFKLPNYKASKKLWKVCVEHHTFFRLTSTEVATTPRKFLVLGSKFRYSGRTQAQTRQASSMIDRPAPLFQRSASKRNSRSMDEAMVSTPDKSTRPVSAPIMSPISPGDIAPSPVTSGLPRGERREASTPTVRKSRSAERKTKEEAKVESKVTEVSKTQSSRPQSTPEFKREGARRSRHHAPAVTTTTNGTERERKSQHSSRERTDMETVRVRKDLDKTQAEILRHHTSISELKRSFMESVPEPRQSEWDKRLSTHSPFRTASINGQLQSGTDGVRTASLSPAYRVVGGVSEIKPNVVKTQTITISDVSNSLRGDVSNKEVPIVHTETKTITYESAQCLLQPVDNQAERDSGVLLSAQTITSETVSTTTTTQITKTVKGGISETRIEKRIVITGDTEIDHDKALAQAIKEAKEQHPDMSVTKVVVHQETEITPD